jgi:UDP:flavonoid glycosyltransferase YjiC (YdhE family)
MALKHINPLRQRVGLPPIQRMMKDWWVSPDLTIAMFPDWFSVPQCDLPKQVRMVGFPLTDSAGLVAPEVDQQLQRILAGFGDERPVVFAPGSAHFQARAFLTTAAEACRRLNLPAILLSTNPDEIPRDLPSNIVAAEYLPFSRLFPHARVVVHHGGIGTTSQCFAAGVSQIVLPMAFDQFDNAVRVAKLGCGSWMPMTRVSVGSMMQRIDGVARTAAAVASVAEYFTAEPIACDDAAQACLTIN